MIFLFFLLSCSTESKPQPECINNTQCSLHEICILESCMAISCLDSTDCAWGSYCSADRSCALGCEESSDCAADEICSDGSCESASCQDPHLDCLLGEFCIDGQCQSAIPSACELCDYDDWRFGMGAEQECVIYSFLLEPSCDWQENTGCDEGMSCFPDDGIGESEEGICIYAYGFRQCTTEEDCPRGFFCKEDIYQDGSGMNVCWGDCIFYREQGLVE